MKVNEKLSILLLLEKSKIGKDGTAPITIRLTIDSKRAELSLGQRIKPELWNQDFGTAIGNSKECKFVNAAIDKAKTKLREVYSLLESTHKNVSAVMLKKAYQDKPTEVVKRTLLQAATFVLDKMEKRVEKERLAPATLTKWKTTEKKLICFLKEKYGVNNINLEDIKYSFAEDFVDYLILDSDIDTNTAMKYLNNVKQFVQTAVERDWLDKNRIAPFPCTYVHPERDILNDAEILALYHKKIHIPRVAEVRDAFLFSCFTGFAYKDASLLTPGHIVKHFDGEDWIMKNREKTWCSENVPLLPIAKEIIDRYSNHPYCVANGLLLPINSNQKYNAYLKELADICGITKNLTTHIARHTFATTVTLANGVPLETVSAMLGHKSIKTTQIYAKIVAKKVREDISKLKERLIITMPESMLSKLFAD